MYGSRKFRHVFGDSVQQLGTLTFPKKLKLSDSDPYKGIVPRGKPMAFELLNLNNMEYAGPNNFLGFLMNFVNESGTLGLEGFAKVTLGYEDLPLRHESTISLLIPPLNSIWEFEGVPDYAGGVDEMIITDSNEDGAISIETIPGSLLGIAENGCWRVAQEGDDVIAKLLTSTLDPLDDDDNIRIRLIISRTFVMPAAVDDEEDDQSGGGGGGGTG
jgi:hypothetical protein